MVAPETEMQSLVGQLISRENTPTSASDAVRTVCGNCKEAKRIYTVGGKAAGVCFSCYWEAHGNSAISWATCPLCGHEWSKLIAEKNCCYDCNDAQEKEIDKKTAIRRRLLKFFHSDKKIAELSLENFTEYPGTEIAFTACKAFNPDADNLYLWGQTGRGKTHLAYAVAQKMLREGKRADILTMRDFVNRFRMCKPEEERQMTDELVRMDVLVLDDLGRMATSDFSLDILANVVDKRGLAGKNGLVVTSNLSVEHLAQQMGQDRLTTRLAGMCRVIAVRGEFDIRFERKGR